MRLRKGVGALAVSGQACNEHGHDASQKNPVESSSAADRGNRRTQTSQLVEIEQIRPDQRAEAAADVSQR